MRLRDIADVDSDSEVTGFAIDHRKVARGSVFGAFKGALFNGEDFIADAVDRGAVAVVARPEAEVDRVPHLADPTPRRLFAELAAKFFAPYPDTVVAVTGTNGKTSTVEMTRQIWRMTGHRSASIGTLGVTTSDDQVKTGLTTPDIVTFLNNMAGLERMGMTHVAYEASSHGLDQHRARACRWPPPPSPISAATTSIITTRWTPISRPRCGCSRSFFRRASRRSIWTDDPKSEEVIERAQRRGHTLLTVGREGETIRLVDQSPTPLGQALLLEHDGRSLKLSLPLIGAYQAANVLVAAGLVMATGVGFDRVFSAMQRVAPVRGRLERAVISRAGVPVYVDYAHTPDALEAAIAALRPHVEGALITVFGAGGDRDQGKRPEMGAVAVRLSDVVIVTDDNPRSEDPGDDPRRRSWPARRARPKSPAAAKPSPKRSASPRAATSSLSPARATRPARSSATACFRSMTRWSPGSAPRERALDLRRNRRGDRRHGERAVRGHRSHLRQPRGGARRPVRRHARHGPRRPRVRRRRPSPPGAAGAIVSQPVAGPHVLVDDVFAALQALGRASRERSRATIIGVTGSVGKTSVKEALYAALDRFRPGKVHRSVKSYNNHTGVPLSLARMPRDADYAVLEMGMNNAGEIAALTAPVRPHVALITAIAPAHIENLGSEDAIADAKAEIFAGLEPEGVAIIPNDTPHRDRLVKAARRHADQIVTFGGGDADVHAVHAVIAEGGGSLISAALLERELTFTISQRGEHWVPNALAVLAAVEALGADVAAAGLALADMAGLKGRGERHRSSSTAARRC